MLEDEESVSLMLPSERAFVYDLFLVSDSDGEYHDLELLACRYGGRMFGSNSTCGVIIDRKDTHPLLSTPSGIRMQAFYLYDQL